MQTTLAITKIDRLRHIRTDDIKRDFTYSVSKMDSQIDTRAKEELETLLLDFSNEIEILDNLYAYLNEILTKREQLEYEEEEKKRVEESKKKKKKHQEEQEPEKKEAPANQEEISETKKEGEGQKPSKIKLAMDKIREYKKNVTSAVTSVYTCARNYIVTKVNDLAVFAKAIREKNQGNLSARLLKTRVESALQFIKAEEIELLMYDLLKAKEELWQILTRLTSAIPNQTSANKTLLTCLDVDPLASLPFIDSYALILKNIKYPDKLYVRSLGENGLKELSSKKTQIFNPLHDSMYKLYIRILDGHILNIIEQHKSLHFMCLSHLKAIEHLCETRENRIKSIARLTIDRINSLVSE